MLRSPERLFEGFRDRGDARALARVFDLSAPKLLSIARHMAPDPASAEDLVQATFVTAIERVGSWDASRPLVPWLVGILARHAAAARRRAGRDRPADELDLDLPARAVEEPPVAVERLELAAAVEAALRKLPDLYRSVLSTYLTDGRRPEEIARATGLRPGTVRVRIHRGLRLLRKAIPGGLATGAVAVSAPRGLAAVRAEILTQAGATGAIPAALPFTATLGLGALMSKSTSVLLALAVTVGLTTTWILTRDDGGAETLHAGEIDSATPTHDGSAALAAVQTDPPPSAPDSTSATVEPGRRPEPGRPDASPMPAAAPGSPAARFDLTGRIVAREDGAPVEGARVRLHAPGPDGSWLTATATSTADGRFLLAAVGFTPTTLLVDAEGYAAFGFDGIPVAEIEAARAASGPVDVGDLELDRGARVSGRVVRALDGAAVAGAELFLAHHLYSRDHRPEELRGRHAWTVGTSGEDGTFTVADRLPFQGRAPLDVYLMAFTGSGSGWTRLDLLAGKGDLEVLVEVDAGAELVVEVTDGAGRPVAGATVEIAPLFAPFAQLGPIGPEHWHGPVDDARTLFSTETDERGRAVLAHVPVDRPREQGVTVVGAAREETRCELLVTPPEGPELREEIVVAGRRHHHRVVIGEARLGTLAGRVVDGRGNGLGRARVVAAGREATVRADGSFRIDALEHDGETLTVEAEEQDHPGRTLGVAWGEERDVRDLEIVLERRAPIAGRVVDEDDGPVAGARAYLSRRLDEPYRALSRDTRTDADGRFVFASADEGDWYLNVWPPRDGGPWSGVRTVRVDGGDEDVVIVLERGEEGRASVRARIVDGRTGAPLDARHAWLAPRRDWSPQAVNVLPPAIRREAGVVAADRVPVGPWRLWARVDERPPAHVDFDVAAGEEDLDLTIEIGDAGHLEVTLALPEDVQADHCMVIAELEAGGTTHPAGEAWRSAAVHRADGKPDATGHLRFENLLPGRYLVTLHHFQYLGEAQVTVEGGETARACVTLRPGGWIEFRGRCSVEQGYVFITLESRVEDWSSRYRRVTVEDGRFEHRVLVPPGRIDWTAGWNAEGDVTRPFTVEVENSCDAILGRTLRVPVQLR